MRAVCARARSLVCTRRLLFLALNSTSTTTTTRRRRKKEKRSRREGGLKGEGEERWVVSGVKENV